MFRQIIAKLNNWLEQRELKKVKIVLKDHFTVDKLLYNQYSERSPLKLQQAEEKRQKDNLNFNDIPFCFSEVSVLRNDIYGFYTILQKSNDMIYQELSGIAAGWLDVIDERLRLSQNPQYISPKQTISAKHKWLKATQDQSQNADNEDITEIIASA